MSQSQSHPPKQPVSIDVVSESAEDGAHYSVDLHVATVFVPTDTHSPEGSIITVQLQARNDIELRALARVVKVYDGKRTEGPAGMDLKLLDVRPPETSMANALVSLRPPSLGVEASQTVTVLVVDDEPSVRQMARLLIESAGYHVLEARNGAEALSVALNEKVGLIISDVNMPMMDGWQLLRLVRSRKELNNVPFLLLTTLTNDEERIKGYSLGVDDYLDKPFEASDLVNRVKQALTRSSARVVDAPVGFLRCDLSRVALGSVLAFLDMERRSGELHVTRGDEMAVLYLHEGRVVRVQAQGHGADAKARLFHVLDWDSGQLELIANDVADDDELGLPTNHLLMEHARLKDEGA